MEGVEEWWVVVGVVEWCNLDQGVPAHGGQVHLRLLQVPALPPYSV